MKAKIILIAFFMSFGLWAQESPDANTPQESSQSEQQTNETNVEQGEEQLSKFDKFYDNNGFNLTPRTLALQWKNIFTSSFYYDSNAFLVEGDDREDDFVFANQLLSSLRYQQKNWQLGVTGLLRYEDYIEDSSLDEFLPSGTIDYLYQGKFFYFSIKEAFARESSPNVADLNDRSPRRLHRLDQVFGIQYKQLTVELLSYHSYKDFEDVDGDLHNYGQALTFKYRLRENISVILETDWDYINYREAAVIGGVKQDDNFGYGILPGIEVTLSTKLYVLAQIGIDYRDSFEYVAWKIFATWVATDNLRFNFSSLRQTIPTFSGNFQLLSAVNVGAEYLFSERTSVKVATGILHINPENGATSYNYTLNTSVLHRLFDGIEVEMFSKLLAKDDSGADFTSFKLGVSLNVIF